MKKLPIGISTLEKIVSDDYVYVDKTPHIQTLLNSGKYYLLSRPQHFGKSLLVDTLHQLFAGNEALFEGLHIHPHWDWSVKYPVIALSFGAGNLRNYDEFKRSAQYLLRVNQERLGVQPDHQEDIGIWFADLIR